MKWSAFIASERELEMMKTYHFARRKEAGRVPTEYKFTLVGKNGGRRNIFLTVDLIPGSDRSVASLIDITSLITAERSLQESRAKLNGILEAFEGDIYICTQDHRIAYMNRSLEKRIGKADRRQPCHRLIYHLAAPCDWCAIDRVFHGETVKSEFQNPVDDRWYYAVSTPISDENDRVVQKQTVVIDIHQRKQAESAIKAQGAIPASGKYPSAFLHTGPVSFRGYRGQEPGHAEDLRIDPQGSGFRCECDHLRRIRGPERNWWHAPFTISVTGITALSYR